MKTWTTPREIETKLRRLWDKGEILAQAEEEKAQWRIPLSGPDSAELLAHFEEAREWIRSLTPFEQPPHSQLEWKEVNHRQLGNNRLPSALIFTGAQAVAVHLHTTSELKRFRQLSHEILSVFPELEPWVKRRPHKVLEAQQHWSELLAVLGWLKAHPSPNIYLRQLDLPGVHTKFVETWKGLLGELSTELGLPERGYPFGFIRKPTLVRLRFLDLADSLAVHGLTDWCPQEWTLRSEDLASFQPQVRQILIVENEITWLALPKIAQTLAIFGSGYGFEHLKGVDWLSEKPLVYWGDLDTHGFGILDQLRELFPHAESLLMDRDTFLTHRALWTTEPSPLTRPLPRLTESENTLYQELVNHKFGQQLRLEQERIGFEWIERQIFAVS